MYEEAQRTGFDVQDVDKVTSQVTDEQRDAKEAHKLEAKLKGEGIRDDQEERRDAIGMFDACNEHPSTSFDYWRVQPESFGDWVQVSDGAKRFAREGYDALDLGERRDVAK